LIFATPSPFGEGRGEAKKSLPVLGRPVLILKIKRHPLFAENGFFDCFINFIFCMLSTKVIRNWHSIQIIYIYNNKQLHHV
jgi:hypothetical protein